MYFGCRSFAFIFAFIIIEKGIYLPLQEAKINPTWNLGWNLGSQDSSISRERPALSTLLNNSL